MRRLKRAEATTRVAIALLRSAFSLRIEDASMNVQQVSASRKQSASEGRQKRSTTYRAQYSHLNEFPVEGLTPMKGKGQRLGLGLPESAAFFFGMNTLSDATGALMSGHPLTSRSRPACLNSRRARGLDRRVESERENERARGSLLQAAAHSAN